MSEQSVPSPRPRRARAHVVEALLLALLGLGLPLLWVHRAQRVVDLSFDSIAALPYGQAQEEIERHAADGVVQFDGERVVVDGAGVPPRVGVGMNPRFFNIGDTPGAVYCGEKSDTWYVLGRFRVLDYVDGEWRTLGVVENQRYAYRAGKAVSR